MKRVILPNVVRGGMAIPLGNNFYYMQGRKHSQGGIDVGESDKTGIEVEGGEVMQMDKNNAKIYSAQPILNGISPAQLVMNGANPSQVFSAQEQYKEDNKINDDGTKKKYRKGGKTSKAQLETEASKYLKEARQIYNKLRAAGYSHIEAAGVLGNIMQESRFQPTATNGSHWGYTQNDKNIKGIIERTYGNYNPESQIKFLIDGYKGKRFGNYGQGVEGRFKRFKSRKSDNYTNAALNWVNDYEAAPGQNDEARVIFANYYGNQFDPNGANMMDIAGTDPTSSAGSVNDYSTFLQQLQNENAKQQGIYQSQLKGIQENYNEQMADLRKQLQYQKDAYDLAQAEEAERIKQQAINNSPLNQYLTAKIEDMKTRSRVQPDIEVPMFYTLSPIQGNNEEKYAVGGITNGRGLYELNVNGRKMLMMYPSTGSLPQSNKYQYNGRGKFQEGGEKVYYYDTPKGRKYTTLSKKPWGIHSYQLKLADKTETDDYWRVQKNRTPSNLGTSTVTAQRKNTRQQQSARRGTSNSNSTPTISTAQDSKYNFAATNKINPLNDINPNSLSVTAKSPSANLSTVINNIKSTKTVPEVQWKDRRSKRLYKKNYNNGITTERKSWFKDYDNLGDMVSLGANTLGNIGAFFINRNALKNMKYNAAPVPYFAAKMKTNYNINPQLDAVREATAATERNINDNTASSNVAMARTQQARLKGLMAANQLYGDKENKETELINADRKNQQDVANKSIEAYNEYTEKKNAFENSLLEKKAENTVSLLNGINAGVQNFVNNQQQRRSDARTMGVYALAHPDLNMEDLAPMLGYYGNDIYNYYRDVYPYNTNNTSTTADNTSSTKWIPSLTRLNGLRDGESWDDYRKRMGLYIFNYN